MIDDTQDTATTVQETSGVTEDEVDELRGYVSECQSALEMAKRGVEDAQAAIGQAQALLDGLSDRDADHMLRGFAMALYGIESDICPVSDFIDSADSGLDNAAWELEFVDTVEGPTEAEDEEDDEDSDPDPTVEEQRGNRP